MIAAFDGNVFSGKTTLIKTLNINLEYNVILEHAFFLGQSFPSAGTEFDMAKNTQEKYLVAEKKRCTNVLSSYDNLLDRSFVSMCAHVFAIWQVHGVDIRKWYLSEFVLRVRNGNIVVPDKYVFVDCHIETIQRRFNLNPGRNTDVMYVHKDYCNAISRFNRLWQKCFYDRSYTYVGDLNSLDLFMSRSVSLYETQDYNIKRICSHVRDLLT